MSDLTPLHISCLQALADGPKTRLEVAKAIGDERTNGLGAFVPLSGLDMAGLVRKTFELTPAGFEALKEHTPVVNVSPEEAKAA